MSHVFIVGDIVRHCDKVKMVREIDKGGFLRLSTLDYHNFPEYNGSYWWSGVAPEYVMFLKRAPGLLCAECQSNLHFDVDYLCSKCRSIAYP